MNLIPGGPFSPKGGGDIQSSKKAKSQQQIFRGPNINDFMTGESLKPKISTKELLSDVNRGEVASLARKLGKPASFFPIVALTMNPKVYAKVIYATFRQMKGKGKA